MCWILDDVYDINVKFSQMLSCIKFDGDGTLEN